MSTAPTGVVWPTPSGGRLPATAGDLSGVRQLTAMLALVTLWLTGSGTAAAQLDSSISFGGPSPSLTVSLVSAAGQPPDSVRHSSGTYTLSITGLGTYTVRAALGTAMPSGVTLKVRLAAPPGMRSTPTSSGWVTLSTTASHVLRNLSGETYPSAPIEYELVATTRAGRVFPSNSRAVNFTVTTQ